MNNDFLRLKNCLKALPFTSLLFICGLVWTAVALLPSQLKAQSFEGRIAGSVTDATGAVIPGAIVTATNLGTNEQHTVKTDEVGEFRIVSLLPAQYKVEVSAPNLKRFVQDTVAVEVDTTTTLNAVLQVGAASETVEVTTQASLLQTESGSVSSGVEGKIVQEMPLNGRNVMNLLALAPGVIPEANTAGAPGINGGVHMYVNGWGNYSIGV